MSYYEDHLNAVAVRIAEKLKSGDPERYLWWFLNIYCGWTETETDEILKRAKLINERSEK